MKQYFVSALVVLSVLGYVPAVQAQSVIPGPLLDSQSQEMNSGMYDSDDTISDAARNSWQGFINRAGAVSVAFKAYTDGLFAGLEEYGEQFVNVEQPGEIPAELDLLADIGVF